MIWPKSDALMVALHYAGLWIDRCADGRWLLRRSQSSSRFLGLLGQQPYAATVLAVILASPWASSNDGRCGWLNRQRHLGKIRHLAALCPLYVGRLGVLRDWS